ncbi:HNH endonuclease [Halorussus caseinilyticus]|uniref:HNH endonuclease n=1 Tax=Halorussus caseinilyticus TaxID=3034025 RepID=A0ABD5WKA9_9EURY
MPARGHVGSEYRLEVHHIVPVRLFRQSENCSTKDAHRGENLVLLRKRCHGRAEHGKITLDAPIELLFEAEREGGRDRHAKPHHADRTI